MKNFKLKSLILSSLVATAVIAPNLTSCSKSTISVNGASIDTSKSHVEVGKDSTIYLIPNKDSKITGIKNITVGSTVLTRMGYNFEYEQTNGLSYKLTIHAKLMTSVDISIDVYNDELEITDVSYSGNTQPATAALTPLSLEVRAKYKNESIATTLTPGEFRVFDATSGTEMDVTEQFLSTTGYKMDQAQKYKIIVKSAIDSSKAFTKDIEIKAPVHDYFYKSQEYDPQRADECKILLANIDPEKHTSVPSIPDSFQSSGVNKKVTSITDNEYNTPSACTDIIEYLHWQSGVNMKTIGTGAFKNLTKLKEFTIPVNVATIEQNAFTNTKALAKVYINSQTIVNIADNASELFNNNPEVYIKEGLDNPTSGYIFTNYKSTETVESGYIKWIKK